MNDMFYLETMENGKYVVGYRFRNNYWLTLKDGVLSFERNIDEARQFDKQIEAWVQLDFMLRTLIHDTICSTIMSEDAHSQGLGVVTLK